MFNAGRNKLCCAVLQVLCLVLFSSRVFGYEAVDEELSFLYGGDDFVSIATGHRQRIAEAPAAATVITAADIRAMGAQDLDQVLESVPGLHVSVSSSAYNPVYIIRGIYARKNPQTLVLINGFPITSVESGNRGGIWAGMPVEMIARIEVIRGPGSALYGADALSGVINIVTKGAADINGLETGVGGGNFDSQRGWLLYGGQLNGWDVGFGVEVFDTSGQRRTVNADAQTLRDTLDGTSASLAPGSVSRGRKLIEARLDLEKDEWRIRMGYQGRRDVGVGAGVNQALDPQGRGDSDRLNLDLTHKTERWFKDWEISNAVSLFDVAMDTYDLHLFPAGVFGGFPNGLIGEPSISERHYRYDLVGVFSGLDNHRVRLGAGYHYLDLYRVDEDKNFGAGLPPADLGPVQTVPAADRFLGTNTRKLKYVFMQDEWRLARNWQLVSGIRYDHFSDFGDTLNPRLALVWTAEQLTTKFLYGSAFRAPSFGDLYNRNNPVSIGNPNLNPEVIDTYELVFDYSFSPDLRAGLNLFYYEMKDLIRIEPVATNSGRQTGKGFEFELEYELSPTTLFSANYACQQAKDSVTRASAANAPQQQIFLKLDQQLAPKWRLTTRINAVMDRKRAAGDSRSEIDDYTTLDLNLRGVDVLPGVTLTASVFNLTNTNAREPARYDPVTKSVAIPGDLPLPGRSFMLTVSKNW